MAVRTLTVLIFAITLLPALVYPVSAYDIQDESLWIFQGAYELAAGNRAELEGFTVKVHSVDMDSAEPSAIVLVYHNRDFKRSFFTDASANSEQIYDNELKINVLGINSGIVSLETYKQKSERVWVTSVPKTNMKVGDTLEDGSYRVKLKEVGESGALVSIEGKNGVFEETYQSGSYRKFAGDFMIRVIYINPNTRDVSIETFRPGAPALTVDILTDKIVYGSNEDISYVLTLTNSGTIPLHGITMTTGSSAGMVGEPHLQQAVLDPLKVKKFIVPVRTPVTPVTRNILIESQVTGYDYMGNEYSEPASFEVQVRPYISIEKKVEAVRNSPKDTEMGTDGHFMITLTLKNTAGYRTTLEVRDELPSSMIPEGVEGTEWTMLLDAGATKEISYTAKPTEAGSFTFKPGTAQWKDGGETYIVESSPFTDAFIVRGSKVIIEKSIVSSYLYTGEMTEIVVSAVNAGNSNVRITLTDSVPEGLSLVSGQPLWEGDIEAGASKKISYVVKTISAGTVMLPAARADYTDLEGKQYSAVSDTPVIYIDDVLTTEHNQISTDAKPGSVNVQTGETPDIGNTELTRIEAAGFLLSAFITLFSLLAIIPALMYLAIRGVYR
ncbi:hypothetical protein [Methanolobus sp.]|uniref:hypothetical protein n=1 Tax=Methanolobus sp. TaxID=1874737 RepID=UPI0025F2C8A6|nr:hypothetical protein [Methanolobus sp.]